MHFTLATVIIALLPFVAAAPQPAKQRGTAIPLSRLSSLVNTDEGVDFEALNSHIASTTAKIFRGFDNFEKNTGAPHPFAMKDIQKRGSGGLSLASFGDHLDRLFGTISVGTPPMYFDVMFDTGSSDLILPNMDCDDSCDGHAIYDSEASSTSTELGKPFSAKFAGGDGAFGYQYDDNVTIAGVTATHQTLGAAVHYSQGLRTGQFAGDGLLGMGFQAISKFDASPFFQTLVAEGQTDEPVFAFNLADPRPELYIGGTNPEMYTGDFAWAPVIQQGYWQVNIDSVVFNGQNVLTSVPAIIDTGSLLIKGPVLDVRLLYAAIGGIPDIVGGGFYSCMLPACPLRFFINILVLVPCDAVPSVSFTFGGTSFPIPAEAFNLGSFGYPPRCIGAIVAKSIPFWSIGTRFLRSVYTVFDVSNPRVGFATLA